MAAFNVLVKKTFMHTYKEHLKNSKILAVGDADFIRRHNYLTAVYVDRLDAVNHAYTRGLTPDEGVNMRGANQWEEKSLEEKKRVMLFWQTITVPGIPFLTPAISKQGHHNHGEHK